MQDSMELVQEVTKQQMNRKEKTKITSGMEDWNPDLLQHII